MERGSHEAGPNRLSQFLSTSKRFPHQNLLLCACYTRTHTAKMYPFLLTISVATQVDLSTMKIKISCSGCHNGGALSHHLHYTHTLQLKSGGASVAV